jgi:hypothetical protein
LRRLYGALNSARESSSLAAEVSRRRYAGPDLDQPRGQPAAPRGPDRTQRAERRGDFSNKAEYNDGEYGHSMGIKV